MQWRRLVHGTNQDVQVGTRNFTLVGDCQCCCNFCFAESLTYGGFGCLVDWSMLYKVSLRWFHYSLKCNLISFHPSTSGWIQWCCWEGGSPQCSGEELLQDVPDEVGVLVAKLIIWMDLRLNCSSWTEKLHPIRYTTMEEHLWFSCIPIFFECFEWVMFETYERDHSTLERPCVENETVEFFLGEETGYPETVRNPEYWLHLRNTLSIEAGWLSTVSMIRSKSTCSLNQ